jgi:hypothetical protein
MSDDIQLQPLRMRPSGTIRLLKPAHNGSAQLSYFIYSCTASNPNPSPHNSKRHHARVNLRPSVLCIRSTMSNSQRTEIRENRCQTPASSAELSKIFHLNRWKDGGPGKI